MQLPAWHGVAYLQPGGNVLVLLNFCIDASAKVVEQAVPQQEVRTVLETACQVLMVVV
jgi:hypothetical protein